jgi:hypothetical protein
MNLFRAAYFAAASAGAAASLPAIAAENKGEVVIESYSCRDLLREAGPEREVAVAFLHGYILGRSGVPKFDVETLRKQTAAFIERCLDDPRQPAVDAMRKSGAGASSPARSP